MKHFLLAHEIRALLSVMPRETRRAARWSVVFAVMLAGMEFLALFMLYPVFGFLAAPSGDATFQLPVLGITADRQVVRYLAVAALGLMILRSILTLIYRRWWLGVTAAAELGLSERMLHTYAYAPYRFHLDRNSSELMARVVANVNLACQSGLVGAVGAVSDLMLVSGLVLALIVANPLAGISVSIYVGLLAFVYVSLTRGMTRNLADASATLVTRVYKRSGTLLRGIREMTIFGLRDNYLQQTSDARNDMVQIARRVTLLQDIPRAVLEVTLYGTVLAALAFLLTTSDPDAALPLVALYVIAGLRLMPTLARLLGNIAMARTGARVADTLSSEMAEISRVSPAPENRKPILGARMPLRLLDVNFTFGIDADHVIEEISLEVPYGTYLGIVGESGSGKTTLTSIILGLLAPSSGSMLYGDQIVEANDPDWFRRVAVVPQDVFVTDESLCLNILAGSAQDDKRLEKALLQAGLGEVVTQLPDGLDTPLLEGGGRLSAGQRQRVGLARALYRSPEILVLDEPTSALDVNSEAHIIATLANLRGKLTIIVVAHRTSTLKTVDRVIRLDRGRIIESGPPSIVLAP